MRDEELRALERAARADPSAAERLERELARVGKGPSLWVLKALVNELGWTVTPSAACAPGQLYLLESQRLILAPQAFCDAFQTAAPRLPS